MVCLSTRVTCTSSGHKCFRRVLDEGVFDWNIQASIPSQALASYCVPEDWAIETIVDSRPIKIWKTYDNERNTIILPRISQNPLHSNPQLSLVSMRFERVTLTN